MGSYSFVIHSALILAVKDVFGSVKKAGVKTVKLDVDEVGPLGNSSNGTTMAFERSHYTFFKEKNEVFDAGKLVNFY